ncbi:PDR/VanB family oxidoreductase [Curvivirga aplysinae]|uniref:PDR/VanB family oxidoreductase n=1 Tax=Curvivirga aplysinae TaxID=2529852 RepID=UPI0012BB8A06|nr:PDR/VanB family oxidoreductase [Curvivirga aplysinae]MTI10974.1 oxidoreductase [Curvivirga aplysinae]
MGTLKARLNHIVKLSDDISDFRFEALHGRFEGMEAGAHIDVHLADDLIRQYSIWEWDTDGKWLSVAVKREDNGRGGSLAMHKLEVGNELDIGGPRNHFQLQNISKPLTLVAGGIGATPIFAMAKFLKSKDIVFKLHYLVRDETMAAFHNAFLNLSLEENYNLHCDDKDGMFDIAGLIKNIPNGGDIYTCGPEPLLNAIIDAGKDLNGGTVHFERFFASSDAKEGEKESFQIEVKSTGEIYDVLPDQTILGVLKEHGIEVEFGCSEGLCGSCIVDVLEGDIDHRDEVLSPEEQDTNEFMCVCISRAKSEKLVLDL